MANCFILPPYVLDAMEKSSSSAISEHAHRTRLLTEQLAECRRTLVPAALVPAMGGRFDEERRVFTCGHHTALPGRDVLDEGGRASNDGAANDAYDAAGKTWTFYKDVLHRDSVDDRGMHLISSVHYDAHYDNAFWNGAQMVYGDGDGVLFGPFTHCIDVIAHELTHGVTQATCDLAYEGQSGALNESISDVFGSLVKQYWHKQTVTQADWLIGAGLFVPSSGIKALRSMKAPGTAFDDPRLGGRDPQPAHMRDYDEGSFDNGGVHVNSGIPNHAFYLAAMALGGHAWEHAGHAWYDAMTSGIRARSSFAEFADATVHAAAKRCGKAGAAHVKAAWDAVGVRVRAAA